MRVPNVLPDASAYYHSKYLLTHLSSISFSSFSDEYSDPFLGLKTCGIVRSTLSFLLSCMALRFLYYLYHLMLFVSIRLFCSFLLRCSVLPSFSLISTAVIFIYAIPQDSCSFDDYFRASYLLTLLRYQGPSSVLSQFRSPPSPQSLLVSELYQRLIGKQSPRILIDGLWLTRKYGGITRVWEQLFSTFSLPGLVSSPDTICLIRRSSDTSYPNSISTLNSHYIDPLDYRNLPNLRHVYLA